MTIEISQVYKSLLANPKQSLNFQKKIYNFALRTKNAELLGKLASHVDLHPEVDDLLRNSDYAVVKAAWASRTGRTFEELENLVKGESRVKILQALAEKENLPEELYIAIAKQSKGQGALAALCTNQSISDETRILAAKNLAHRLNSASDTRSNRSETIVSTILSSSVDLADTIVENTSNLAAIIAAATRGFLKPSNQLKVANLISDSVAKLKVETSRYAYHGYSWAPDVAKSMATLGKIDKEASSVIIQALNEVVNHHSEKGNTYYENEALEAVKLVKSNTTKPFTDYVKMINECKSFEELSTLVEKIKLLVSTTSRSNNSIRSESVALAVIASQYSDERLVDEVAHWLSWYTCRQALKVTGDLAKIAILLYHFPYLGYESVLSKTVDPCKCLEKLISIIIEKNSSIPSELLSSKYLTKDVISKLPLSVFYNDTLPGYLLSMIGAKLESELETDESWTTFESLGSSFNGTIEELLQVSKSI